MEGVFEILAADAVPGSHAEGLPHDIILGQSGYADAMLQDALREEPQVIAMGFHFPEDIFFFSPSELFPISTEQGVERATIVKPLLSDQHVRTGRISTTSVTPCLAIWEMMAENGMKDGGEPPRLFPIEVNHDSSTGAREIWVFPQPIDPVAQKIRFGINIIIEEQYELPFRLVDGPISGVG